MASRTSSREVSASASSEGWATSTMPDALRKDKPSDTSLMVST
jgi:hypothetical protein